MTDECYFIDEDRMNLRFPVYEYGKFKRFSWSNFLVGKKVHSGTEIMGKPEQCTGLKDNNGRLVYAGDFLYYKGEVCLVFWSEPTACFGVMLQGSGYTDYAGDIKRSDLYSIDGEVIGNIHENKELLND